MAGIEENGGGGGAILDVPFGVSWNGDTKRGASRNALYDKIITIGAGFGNTAFVRTTGDDATAMVGNVLFPFLTIGAASAALGVLDNSTMDIDAGLYILNDTNAPYGLKSPNSKYDIYCHPNCVIEYYGTWGMYISNENTNGSVYGFGFFKNYSNSASGAAGGQSGYAFNIGVSLLLRVKSFVAINIYNYGTVRCARVADIYASNAQVIINMGFGNIWSFAGKTALKIDSGICLVINSTIATSGSGGTEPAMTIGTVSQNGTTRIYNCLIYAHGRLRGANQDVCLEISNSNQAALLDIYNCIVRFNTSNASSKLIKFTSPLGVYGNTSIRSCTLSSRLSIASASGGYSIEAVNALSLKIIDTYAQLNTTGAVLTNLVPNGVGLVVNSNIS